MQVDPAKAAGTSVFEGTTYYFCGKGCKARFDAEPGRYVRQGLGTRDQGLEVPSPKPQVPSPKPLVPSPQSLVPAAKYTCPMHPEIIRDAPGSCPICGMALE